MKVNAPGQIRFCDEYERLLQEFLQSLTKWKQAESSERFAQAGEANAGIELLVAKQESVWALVTLQGHSRECLLCEESLRRTLTSRTEAHARQVRP